MPPDNDLPNFDSYKLATPPSCEPMAEAESRFRDRCELLARDEYDVFIEVPQSSITPREDGCDLRDWQAQATARFTLEGDPVFSLVDHCMDVIEQLLPDLEPADRAGVRQWAKRMMS